MKLFEHLKQLAPFDVYSHLEKVQSILEHLESIWQHALDPFADSYGIEGGHDNLPDLLEKISFDRLLLEGSRSRTIGLAGPGAVGKNKFAEALAYERVINTTTRLRRKGERDGVDYHFVSEDEFADRQKKSAFLVTQYRVGRGMYGIEHDSIERALLLANGRNCLVEENPVNLLTLSKSLEPKGKEFVLICLLPPYPMLAHLAMRLAHRCDLDGTDLASTLESTLGQRQVTEIASLAECVSAGMKVLLVVNDDLRRAVSKTKTSIERGLV